MTSGERSTFEHIATPRVAVLVHARSEPGKLVGLHLAAARKTRATVITGQHLLDLDPYIGLVVRDLPLLAIDRIRYSGEPVAVVVAGSVEEARDAAALIEIEVAPLPPGVTGAPNGAVALVHLTEMLRPGPQADEVAINRERTNRLIGSMADSPYSGAIAVERNAKGETSETLSSTVRLFGDGVSLESGAVDQERTRPLLSSLFDDAGLSFDIVSGRSRSSLAPIVDAIAVATARNLRQPVTLVANTADFGWRSPAAAVHFNGNKVIVTIDAGASAGELPAFVDEIRRFMADRQPGRETTIVVDYSERPPIAGSLDAWRELLSRE